VIFGSPTVTAAELERGTGWSVTREGLCKGDRCIPIAPAADGTIAVDAIAAALGAPLVADDGSGLFAVGPESGGRALVSATAPDLELSDLDGRTFHLSSLIGQKVLLVAWAPL